MSKENQPDGWTEVMKCKVCGSHPFILPAGRGKKVFVCDHEGQEGAVKTYSSVEEWNSEQLA